MSTEPNPEAAPEPLPRKCEHCGKTFPMMSKERSCCGDRIGRNEAWVEWRKSRLDAASAEAVAGYDPADKSGDREAQESLLRAISNACSALAATPAEPAGERSSVPCKLGQGYVHFDGDEFYCKICTPKPPISPATTAGGEARFASCAQWPSDIDAGTTRDFHDTEEQAKAVCRLLEKRGFGGDGRIFPIRTWVEQPTQPEGDAKEEALKLANAISSQAMQTASDIWTAVNDALCEEGPILKESMRDKLAVGLVPVFHRIAAMAKTEEGRG